MKAEDYVRVKPPRIHNFIRLSTFCILCSFLVSYLALSLDDVFGAIFMCAAGFPGLIFGIGFIFPDVIYSMKVLRLALGIHSESIIEARVSGVNNELKVSFSMAVVELRRLPFYKIRVVPFDFGYEELYKVHVIPGGNNDVELRVISGDQEFQVNGEILYAVGFTRKALKRKDCKKEDVLYQVAEISAGEDIYIMSKFDEDLARKGILSPAANEKLILIKKSELIKPAVYTMIDLLMISLNILMQSYAIYRHL